MPERITFRGRGRGCIVEDSDAVSLVEPRVKFVKGWLTGGTDPEDGSVECGDGTNFCLEVTLDQLAEIAYRVRDGWFTAGSATFGGITVAIGGSAPMSRFASSEDPATIFGRGYTFIPNELGVVSYHPNDNHLTTAYNPFDGTPDPDGHRDLKDTSEAALWMSYDAGTGFQLLWANTTALNISMDCGSFNGDPATAPHGCFPLSPDPDDGSCSLGFAVSPRCAYVGADDPHDPDVRLFLFCVFGFYAISEEGSIDVAHFPQNEFDVLLDFDLVIELADSTLHVPLYGEADTGTNADFVWTATKWWPYKTKAGDPAWDEDTGQVINGGPIS
jgi:hypothetical protein